jgi:hypothetical protein
MVARGMPTLVLMESSEATSRSVCARPVRATTLSHATSELLQKKMLLASPVLAIQTWLSRASLL